MPTAAGTTGSTEGASTEGAPRAPQGSDAAIVTSRLSLELLKPDTLRALLAHDLERASESQGLALPPAFVAEDGSDDSFLAFHLAQVRDHPEVRAWCVRAMVRRADGAVVGNCGFHGPPRAVGRAEIGYTVIPSARGEGFATEAARALVRWAFSQGEPRVFASVASTNAPSLAVVSKVGFVQSGSRVDEQGGEELVFEVHAPAGAETPP